MDTGMLSCMAAVLQHRGDTKVVGLIDCNNFEGFRVLHKGQKPTTLESLKGVLKAHIFTTQMDVVISFHMPFR